MKRSIIIVISCLAWWCGVNAAEYAKFNEHDTNSNGSLDIEEFGGGAAWKSIFDAVDSDKNGSISREELIAFDQKRAGQEYVWLFNTGDDTKFQTIQPIELFEHAGRIDCSNNEIADVDLQYNPDLWQLLCPNNLFSSLDFSHNLRITHVECYGNQIGQAAMEELISSLPAVENGTLVVVDTQNANEKNICTAEQVAAAKAKGWNVYDHNGGDVVEYTGSSDLPTTIEEMNAPTAKSGQRHNLMGQPAGRDYKGIVIENGKKILVK